MSSLWQSYDAYSADSGERLISAPPGTLETRSHPARNIRSTGFRQFEAVEVSYDERAIQHPCDALARLTEADHGDGNGSRAA